MHDDEKFEADQVELARLTQEGSRRRKRGERARKTYRPEMATRAREVALLGGVDKEIAKALGISINSVTRWKKRYPEFGEAIANGKRDADIKVAVSLFRMAHGYTYTAYKVVVVKGQVVAVPFEKHQPPNVHACIFWLRQRRPDLWSERALFREDEPSDEPEILTPEQEDALRRIKRVQEAAEAELQRERERERESQVIDVDVTSMDAGSGGMTNAGYGWGYDAGGWRR